MKKVILWMIFGILGVFAVVGIAGAVVLYPTHAANGTSVGYFTMVVFPTVFLLTGLAGIRFRYWWVGTAGLWLILLGYLAAAEGVGAWLLLMLAYLLPAGLAGGCGVFLRRQIRPK